MTDWELLESYAREGSEEAFAELVKRHLAWVYSVALRRVNDPSLAEEIAQSVFILLAKKASTLRRETFLAGWLFRATRCVSSSTVRQEVRRQNREQKAAAMIESTALPHAVESLDPMPLVDEAVAALSASDRAAVLMRFYENQTMRELGERLGLSEEAARKRVSRALEKMRQFLEAHGAKIGGAALATCLESRTVTAVPAHVMHSVLNAGLASVKSSTFLVTARETSHWTISKLVAGLVTATIAIVLLGFAFNQRNHEGSFMPEEEANGRAGAGSTHAAKTTNKGERSRTGFLFQVVEAESGQGLGAAQVAVSFVVQNSWRRGEDLLTDAAGICIVPIPETGLTRLDVGAIKDGFVQKFFTWRLDYDVPLPAGYVLKLEPAVRIGGRVIDPIGNPVSGAEISVHFVGNSDATFREPTFERFGFVGGTLPAARTDSEGSWSCALTPPGSTGFNIEVRHPDFVDAVFRPVGDSGYAASESESVPLTLGGLHARSAVFRLERGYSVPGLVTDEQNQPVAGARITLLAPSNYRHLSVTSDVSGAFRVSGLPLGASQIAVLAKGFAPSSHTIEAGPTAARPSLQLVRGTTLPIQVVDEFGLGIEGASATLHLAEPHNADLSVTTDANGKATFEEVPTNALVSPRVHATAKGFFIKRNATLNPHNPVVALVQALRVSGSVIDDATGLPIPDFKVIPCTGEGVSGYDRSATRRGESGIYTVHFSEFAPPFRVRIEAPGYEPAMSQPMSHYPPDQVQDFRVRRVTGTNSIHGSVLNAAGRPAAKIAVALLTFNQGVTLYRGKLQRQEGALLTVTDEAGAFEFPSSEGAHSLVAADPDAGFALIRLHRTSRPLTLRLEPWGRIEGVVLRSGHPAAQRQVIVQRGPSTFRSVVDGLAAPATAVTDKHGRFSCDFVPPGDVTLYLNRGADRSLSHATSALVQAGRVSRISIGARALVKGHLAPSENRKVDWSRQIVTAALISQRPRPRVEPPSDAPNFAARLRLLDFFDDCAEWHAYERTSHSFPLEVQPDGGFIVENVPPGNYRIVVRLADFVPSSGIRLDRILGAGPTRSAEQDVTIPDAPPTSEIDLETIYLQAVGESTRRAAADAKF